MFSALLVNKNDHYIAIIVRLEEAGACANPNLNLPECNQLFCIPQIS